MNGAAFPPTLIPIFAAMGAGYLIRKAGLLEARAARRIMVGVQKFVTPIVLIVSFWGLESVRPSFLVLPLAGIAVMAFQLAAAFWLASRLGLEGPSKGAFLIGALLSNIGYLGWFVNLELFGKTGFDYAFVYGFYFQFAVYLAGYPIAARYGEDEILKRKGFLSRLFFEGILLIALLAIAFGLLLKFGRIPMPEWIRRAHPLLIQTATGTLMFAAGLTMKIREFRGRLVPSLAMCFLKLVATPIAFGAVLCAVSAQFSPDPVMLRVVLVESAMPLAISCLTISALFRLDQDLANTMWLLSTFLFIPALHLLAFIL